MEVGSFRRSGKLMFEHTPEEMRKEAVWTSGVTGTASAKVLRQDGA